MKLVYIRIKVKGGIGQYKTEGLLLSLSLNSWIADIVQDKYKPAHWFIRVQTPKIGELEFDEHKVVTQITKAISSHQYIKAIDPITFETWRDRQGDILSGEVMEKFISKIVQDVTE